MKLSSNPKPVRFRIESGGEEHSSLDSLKHNFCIEDLQKIEKQLHNWLKRQGEEGEKIAHRLEAMPNGLSNSSSLDDYFSIYQIFFYDIVFSFSDSNSSFSKNGTLRDLYLWFKKERNYHKNLRGLESLLWEFDENFCLFVIEESLNDRTFNKKYLEKLVASKSGLAAFLLGRYHIEYESNFTKGRECLLYAKKKGFAETVDTFMEEKQLAQKYNQWSNINVGYMKRYIKRCVKTEFALSMESIINIPMENDSHEWTEEEKDFAKFVVGCCLLRNCKNEKFRYELAKKVFTAKTDKGDTSVVNPFYLQKFFIIVLIGLKLPASMGYKNHYLGKLRELADYYYPANYLLDPKATHPLLDNAFFRELGTSGQISIFLNNIFEF